MLSSNGNSEKSFSCMSLPEMHEKVLTVERIH
ncbi:hypothetical protein QFZ99_002917 [Paraburkholderia atlantica]